MSARASTRPWRSCSGGRNPEVPAATVSPELRARSLHMPRSARSSRSSAVISRPPARTAPLDGREVSSRFLGLRSRWTSCARCRAPRAAASDRATARTSSRSARQPCARSSSTRSSRVPRSASSSTRYGWFCGSSSMSWTAAMCGLRARRRARPSPMNRSSMSGFRVWFSARTFTATSSSRRGSWARCTVAKDPAPSRPSTSYRPSRCISRSPRGSSRASPGPG